MAACLSSWCWCAAALTSAPGALLLPLLVHALLSHTGAHWQCTLEMQECSNTALTGALGTLPVLLVHT